MPQHTTPPHNPNTPQNWDARWKRIARTQADDPWVQDRLRKVASLIQPGDYVLDIAAGPGLIQSLLPPHTLYTPNDFSPEAIHLSGGKGILAPCDAIPLPPKIFHTVLAMEILEHLDDENALILPAMVLARRQVIFTVPKNRLPQEQFEYHLRTYTQDTLRNLLVEYFPPAFSLDSPYGPFRHLYIHTTPGNIIAQCTLQ